MKNKYDGKEKKDHLKTLLGDIINNLETEGKFIQGFSVQNSGTPRNAFSKHVYKGINNFVLSMSGHQSREWASFNQVKAYNKENGTNIHLRKGEEGTPIYAYVESSILKKDELLKIQSDFKSGAINKEQHDKLIDDSKRMVLAYSTHLFNGSQFENFPVLEAYIPKTEFEEVKELEIISKAMKEINNVPIHFHQRNAAFFNGTQKAVFMPPKEAFVSESEFYSTLLHEYVHATGHEDFLNRDTAINYNKDIKIRAKEEMTAELGSFIACKTFGVKFNHQTDINHREYVKSYLSVLKGDDGKKEMIKAFSRASKAVDFLEQTRDKYVLTLENTMTPEIEKQSSIDLMKKHNIKMSSKTHKDSLSMSM
jgi:antirestriction protein ArdC